MTVFLQCACIRTFKTQSMQTKCYNIMWHRCRLSAITWQQRWSQEMKSVLYLLHAWLQTARTHINCAYNTIHSRFSFIITQVQVAVVVGSVTSFWPMRSFVVLDAQATPTKRAWVWWNVWRGPFGGPSRSPQPRTRAFVGEFGRRHELWEASAWDIPVVAVECGGGAAKNRQGGFLLHWQRTGGVLLLLQPDAVRVGLRRPGTIFFCNGVVKSLFCPLKLKLEIRKIHNLFSTKQYCCFFVPQVTFKNKQSATRVFVI